MIDSNGSRASGETFLEPVDWNFRGVQIVAGRPMFADTGILAACHGTVSSLSSYYFAIIGAALDAGMNDGVLIGPA
jgi:hypothetical protein